MSRKKKIDMQKRSGVFIELYVEDIPYYVDFFTRVLDFTVLVNHSIFVELRRGAETILLNGEGKTLESEHYFFGKLNSNPKGTGVEIGIVVDNLQDVYQKALKFNHLKCTPIVKQEWGMSDFRIVLPDGYYLRLTTS